MLNKSINNLKHVIISKIINKQTIIIIFQTKKNESSRPPPRHKHPQQQQPRQQHPQQHPERSKQHKLLQPKQQQHSQIQKNLTIIHNNLINPPYCFTLRLIQRHRHIEVLFSAVSNFNKAPILPNADPIFHRIQQLSFIFRNALLILFMFFTRKLHQFYNNSGIHCDIFTNNISNKFSDTVFSE